MSETQILPQISIMGCGWLGLPLGTFLVEQAYQVKGSTTRSERRSILEEKGIKSFQIVVEENLKGENIPAFFQSDILILNIPPGRRRPDVETFHPKQIQAVVDAIQNYSIKKLIFISSTGVYGNLQGNVNEDTRPFPTRASGRALWTIEQNLLELTNVQLTTLRMAGLVGGDRKAGRFLAGKKDVPNGADPVNLVHLEDCIQVIYQVIKQNKWGTTFNVCADKHPSRASFYISQAQKQGFEPPEFLPGESSKSKIISNKKLKSELNYSFIHPDPMKF